MKRCTSAVKETEWLTACCVLLEKKGSHDELDSSGKQRKKVDEGVNYVL